MLTKEMNTTKGWLGAAGKKLIRMKNWVYPLLLLGLAMLLILLSYRGDSLYGSTTDWFAQHVSVAETMRQTMLEEGTLFPGQLPLGGGTNIYDFSYYGYLRPDILLSCLMPKVPMELIIPIYSVTGYLCGVLLFYRLLNKTGLTPEWALVGGILFLGAGCFFHIHRHVMFVNYMPFLLGAMLGVLRYHRTGKKGLTLLMMALIPLHSFYYAISSLLVLYLFFLYTAPFEKGGRWRQWWSLNVRYGLWVLTIVAMTGVLLLPTAASILNCAGTKDGGNGGTSPWQMNWSLEALLYNGYGLGLTLMVLFLLLLSLCRKKARLLAAGILFTLICGLVPLVLNGFLYNRAKILIPFLPLVLFLCMETLGEFWSQRRRPFALLLIPIGWVAYLQYKAHKVTWVWVDLALVCLVFLVLLWRWQKKQKLQAAAMGVSLVLMCALVCLFAVILHQNETYISREKAVVSRFSKEEREEFYQRKDYRFDTYFSPYHTGNCLLAYGAGRSSMYTSTANPVYSEFFYDEIKTPIGSNNRVGLYSRANPFLTYLMGVRYLETKESVLPVGYEIRSQKGTAVLTEGAHVLPLCYGSVELLSEKSYEKLSFPENLEALTSVSIVEEGTEAGEEEFISHFTEWYPQKGVDYALEKKSDTEFSILPITPIENQILVVCFQVTPKSRAEVAITINEITNKLSGASAAYPNHNRNFTYLLSSNEAMREFNVKTSGKFQIENLHIYSLDTAYLWKISAIPLEEPSQEEGKSGNGSRKAGFGQKELVRGSITMPKEGYLITSYPMQPGYTAYVDGKSVSVETVNLAFAGLPLTEGTHEIQLRYEPPLQKAGMALSVTGWLFWAGTIALEGLRQRKREDKT